MRMPMMAETSQSKTTTCRMRKNAVAPRHLHVRPVNPISNHTQLKKEMPSTNHPSEMEADRISESVLKQPALQTPARGFSAEAMRRPEAGLPQAFQQKMQTPGQALPSTTRSYMENRFQRDFSHVRIHNDEAAAETANRMQARAVTAGNHILFGTRQFAPESREGNKLIAHELTHVVQQTLRPHRTASVSSRSAMDTARQGMPAITQRESGVGIHRKITTDPSVDLSGCFCQHGVAGYIRNGNSYSAPPAQSAAEPLDKEIISTMLQSPRDFSVYGINTADASSSLEDHIDARTQVVKYARAAIFAFGAGKNVRMNPAFWDQKTWKVLPGVDRMTALKDLYNPQSVSRYAISCQQARDIIMEIGGGGSDGLINEFTSELDKIPGEAGYVGKAVANQPKGLEGENIIYVGNGLWWGHLGTPAYHTLDQWKIEVNNFPPVAGGAYVSRKRTRPTAGLID